MQISHMPLADKGVTTLMYLSDDDAVEKATARPSQLRVAATMAAAVYVGSKIAGRKGAMAGAALAVYSLFYASRR
jgi:hypothetical protein